MSFSFLPPKKLTIWLIGDSTMSIKEKKAYPETGWGMPFANFWDSSVTIDNRAKNGRSSKSFMAENLWQPVVDNLKEGDYVFIQFGHNDESVNKAERYSTPEQFKDNLIKYITESRSKKAIPVLITPVSRLKFEGNTAAETHPVYAQIVRDVAKENNVTLIDLDEKSKSLLQQLGPDKAPLLFNHLLPGEHPNYPEGKDDNTHFNELGARKMAELVLAEIRTAIPELAQKIVIGKIKK